jgi:hypothetical protein
VTIIININFREPANALPPSTTLLRSLVRVSDSGTPSLENECEFLVRVYQITWTVNVTVRGDANTNVTFEQLLEDFLALNIIITGIVPINSTHFRVQVYGKNNTVVVGSEMLVARIGNLTEEQKDLLEQAGIFITGVVSNVPTEPPSRTPIMRAIPTWAVVVIVVLNSVIIVAVLLIILFVLLGTLRK